MAELKSYDKKYYQKIVTDNLGLVHSIIKRYLNRGVDYDDLFQIGCIGLLNAAKRYNSSLGYEFSTYACSLIIGEIKRYFRDDGIIKVSRHIKETAIKLSNISIEYEKEHGQCPTLTKLSEISGISTEDITFATDAIKSPKSIYEKNSDGISLADTLSTHESEFEKSINKITLSTAVNNFSERDKSIIIYRYYKDKTQSETAKLLNISQVQVSRIEKALLKKLKAHIHNF